MLELWETLDEVSKFRFLTQINKYSHIGSVGVVFNNLVKKFVTEREGETIVSIVLKNAEVRGTLELLKLYEFRPTLTSLTNTQLITLLEAQIQQPFDDDGYYGEGILRADLNNIFNNTTVLTDIEKLSLHRQIDQQYPDQPLEDLLSAYEKAEEKRGDFFWGDAWRHANPETKIKFIHAVAENETFDEHTSYEVSKVIKDYYFYPEAKDVFDMLLKDNPLVLLEGDIIFSRVPPEYIIEMIEQLPFDVFQEYVDSFKRRGNFEASYKEENFDVLEAVMKKIEGKFPGVIEVLERQIRVINFDTVPDLIIDNRSLREFLQDSALALVGGINPNWVPKEDIDITDTFYLAEHRLMIARNLYFQGIRDVKNITEDVVKAASKEIIQKRAEVRDIPLFKDRVVVVFAGNEMRDNEFAFGKIDTLEEMRRQGAVSVEKFSPEKTSNLNPSMNTSEIERVKQDVEVVKKEGLSQIVSTVGKIDN